MSADDALARRVEAALVRRFAATDARVTAWGIRGAWRAHAHVTRADGRLTIECSARHARKRDALRGLAEVAGVADEPAEMLATADAPQSPEGRAAGAGEVGGG